MAGQFKRYTSATDRYVDNIHDEAAKGMEAAKVIRPEQISSATVYNKDKYKPPERYFEKQRNIHNHLKTKDKASRTLEDFVEKQADLENDAKRFRENIVIPPTGQRLFGLRNDRGDQLKKFSGEVVYFSNKREAKKARDRLLSDYKITAFVVKGIDHNDCK